MQPFELLERGLRHRVVYPLSMRFASRARPSFIPLDLLPLIGVTEDRLSVHGPGAFPVPSFFDRLREQGGTYRYLMFPDLNGDDGAVLSAALAGMKEGRDLYLLKFADADALCHLHGSEGEVRRQVARELDRKVHLVVEAFERVYAEPGFMVVGDHGMMDVDTTVDVAAACTAGPRSGLRHGRDYLLFLDSTLARLWSFNDRARAALEDVFISPPLDGHGRLIDGETAARCRIPAPGLRYGEQIWWADPGVLIHPDYFHPRHQVVRGMHGYDPGHEKMRTLAVIARQDTAGAPWSRRRWSMSVLRSATCWVCRTLTPTRARASQGAFSDACLHRDPHQERGRAPVKRPGGHRAPSTLEPRGDRGGLRFHRRHPGDRRALRRAHRHHFTWLFTPGYGLNVGVAASRGEVVAFLSGHAVPYDEKWSGSLLARSWMSGGRLLRPPGAAARVSPLGASGPGALVR